MVKIFLLLICSFGTLPLFAQANDSSYLLRLNQLTDDYVVARNTAALDTIYADDFVFNHGSGKTEGKEGWYVTVKRANYPLRAHDSVKVELHGNVAILRGKMNIQKVNKDKTDKYWLKYVRVYVLRGRWRLVSHSTVAEAHE